METNQTAAKTNKTRLSAGERALLLVVTFVSLPGYLGLVMYWAGTIFDKANGPPQSPIGDKVIEVFHAAGALPFIGIVAHPAALLIVFVSSFLPIGGRGKARAWMIVVGGLAAWMIAWHAMFGHGW